MITGWWTHTGRVAYQESKWKLCAPARAGVAAVHCSLKPCQPELQSPLQNQCSCMPLEPVSAHMPRPSATACPTQPELSHSPVGEWFSPLKPVHKVWRRWLLLQILRYQCKAARNTKNQGNLSPPKEYNKFPVINPKEIEIYKLTDQEFKIIFK